MALAWWALSWNGRSQLLLPCVGYLWLPTLAGVVTGTVNMDGLWHCPFVPEELWHHVPRDGNLPVSFNLHKAQQLNCVSYFSLSLSFLNVWQQTSKIKIFLKSTPPVCADLPSRARYGSAKPAPHPCSWHASWWSPVFDEW